MPVIPLICASLQESAGSDTLAMLEALGADGQADGRLALHSVLAGGKRRATAELQHARQQDGEPVLRLARVRKKTGAQLSILQNAANAWPYNQDACSFV